MKKAQDFSKVDRSRAVLKKTSDADDAFVNASESSLAAFVWELTAELYSLGGSDAEQRLQRNVANLIKQ